MKIDNHNEKCDSSKFVIPKMSQPQENRFRFDTLELKNALNILSIQDKVVSNHEMNASECERKMWRLMRAIDSLRLQLHDQLITMTIYVNTSRAFHFKWQRFGHHIKRTH